MYTRIIMGVIVLAVVVAWVIGHARAGPAEREEALSDPSRSEWFSSLKRPGTEVSCCDVSDCGRTQAKQMDDGLWQAMMRTVNGAAWAAIPPEIVLRNKPSPDGEAYLCQSEPISTRAPKLYCFIPPTPGF